MPVHISIHTCFISLLKNKIHSASEDCPGGLTGRSAVIVGGGPAGLMAAEVLIEGGVRVDVYDAMPSVGRKFLMAGKGGVNITHVEPMETFLSRYGANDNRIKSVVNSFGPKVLREWVRNLGIETFVGTSGRVFPVDMKAAPLLRAWVRRLRNSGVNFYVRHRWHGWNDAGELRFVTPQDERVVATDAVVLALGGGSWPRLGSDGAWTALLAQRGIPVETLRPANCGFDVGWSEYFETHFAGHPVKSVTVTHTDASGRMHCQQGDLLVTRTGLEGGLIYALSAPLRDDIAKTGAGVIYLDLAPGRDLSRVVSELTHQRDSRSLTNRLRSRLNIKGVKAALLREALSALDLVNPERLAGAIKSLPIRLIAPRPLSEAISSAGGVTFEALDERLMVREMPGMFCAGEMLDWEAPTGGYLLTACFASGRTAGLGALAYLGCENLSRR